MIGPLLSGRLLSGHEFLERHGPLPAPAALVAAATLVSMAVIPLVWAGVAAAAWEQVRARHATEPPDTTAVRQVVMRIALAGLVLHMLLYGVLRVPPYPQYFFGTFGLHVLLAWLGVHLLDRLRPSLGTAVTAAWGASLAFITVGTLWHVHRAGWERGYQSPTLANQVEVARALNRYYDRTVLTDVITYQKHPNGIRALRLVYPPEPTHPRTHSGRLVIRYRPGQRPNGSEIELVELPPDADPPPGLKPLDVTPMPRWY